MFSLYLIDLLFHSFKIVLGTKCYIFRNYRIYVSSTMLLLFFFLSFALHFHSSFGCVKIRTYTEKALNDSKWIFVHCDSRRSHSEVSTHVRFLKTETPIFIFILFFLYSLSVCILYCTNPHPSYHLSSKPICNCFC